MYKRTKKVWGKAKRKGDKIKFNFLDHRDKAIIKDFLADHEGHVVYMQLGTEQDDFALPWLRFWWGVVVKMIAEHFHCDYEIIHEGLKEKFFPHEYDHITGLPKRKSMARDGNIGAKKIKMVLPVIQKWAIQHGVIIPDKGSFYCSSTKKMIHFNLKNNRILGKEAAVEKKYEIKPQQIIDSNELQNITPLSLIAMAIDKNVDINRLEKLVELQERFEKKEAEKAYWTAMTKFKKDYVMPKKDAKANIQLADGKKISYTYTSIGHNVEQVTQKLAQHGFSIKWEYKNLDTGLIQVTCIIAHCAGHSERVVLSAPPDTKGLKNNLQAIGSTTTFLRRYTMSAALGIASQDDDDDDGNLADNTKASNGAITEDQRRMFINFIEKCT